MYITSTYTRIFTDLYNSFEGLVTFLIGPGLLEVAPDADVLTKKDFSMVLQPIQDLKENEKLNSLFLIPASCTSAGTATRRLLQV